MYKKILDDMRKEIDQPVEPILPSPARRGLVNQRSEPEPEAPSDPLSLMREWAHRIKASSSKFQQQAAEERLSKPAPSAAPQIIVQEAPKKDSLVKRPSAFDIDVSDSGSDDFSLDVSDAATLLRQKEGFRNKPYWDVNAYRVGYGSDTITKEDGTIIKVTPDMYITKEDAERDLKRRTGEFASKAASKVGEQSWEALPEKAKAALISVTYNYGHLPNSVASAVREGSLGSIASAVEGLASHNEGINKKRRLHEAALIRSSI